MNKQAPFWLKVATTPLTYIIMILKIIVIIPIYIITQINSYEDRCDF